MTRISSPFATHSGRNMFLFFTGKLASILGSGMYTFAVGLYILKLTGSGSSFAVTMVCGMLPRILLAPFAGVMADRMNRRRLLIFSDLAAVLTLLSAFAAVTVSGDSLLPVYISLSLLSVCSTFYSISVSSSLLQLVDEHELQRAGSLNQMAGSIGNLLAPVLGGVLFAIVPLKLFMLLNAAGFAVSTIMSCALRFKPAASPACESALPAAQESTEQNNSSAFAELRSSLAGGFTYVSKNVIIRTILIIVFWINFFVVSLNVVLPFAAVETLGLSSGQYGALNATFAAGMLAVSLLLSVRRQSSSPAGSLIRGLLALGVIFIVMALPLYVAFSTTGAFILLMALMFIAGGTVIYINIPIQVYLQQTVEEDYLGRVFAVVETVSAAIAPAGMILYGVLVDQVPSEFLLTASGAAIVVITLLGRRSLKQDKGQETGQHSRKAGKNLEAEAKLQA